ncbi:MAG: flagellar basal-body MS-ring/collar protein FliF [Candidatus Caldatribacteriaceae bacterium]
MNQWQKMLFILLTTVLLAGIVMVFLYSGRPDYAPVFSSSDPGESGKVVDRLKELGIPYRLSQGGTRVEVPQDRVYEARMQLAQEGLPTKGSGFELMDKNTFGLTSFLQKVNYQRALQGEIERTIMHLEGVEGARVHLVIPEKKLFLEEKQEPTASVVLRLRPGRVLQDVQVQAIANLVANSVEGLSPERVAILDERGNILASGVGDASGFLGTTNLTAAQLEMKREVEKSLSQQIQSMLEGVLGYRQAVVRVSADLDFERKEGEKEVYEPVTGGEGIVRSTQEIEEKYQGDTSLAGGKPGVASNIPIYGEESATQRGSNYNRRESTTNYEMNRIVERFASFPGKVQKLSVAVLVDSNLPKEAVEKVRKVVQAAAGINLERGDVVIVEALPFDRSAQEQEAKILASQKFMNLLELLIKYGIIAFLILLFYSLGRKILVAAITPEEVTAEVYEEKQGTEEYEKTLEAVMPPSLARPIELSPEEKMKLELQKKMEEEIRRLVETNPENATKLVRSWLSED